MNETKGYICWVLDEQSREELLRVVPPEYQTVICHHVTLAFDVEASTPLPTANEGWVVGEIMDNGVQAVVVEIEGNTIRPDGKRFHVTISLDAERHAQESIGLTSRGWWPLAQRLKINLVPTFVEHKPK